MVKILFWVSLLLIVYSYVGYIACCVIIAKLFAIKLTKRELYPPVSIIVPCYNEEKVIARKLENLLALEYPREKIQIIVASESTDATNDIVLRYKEQGVLLYAAPERLGKTELLYASVPLANGEILVFSDANVTIGKEAVKHLAGNFADERVGAVTGSLVVTNPAASSISWGEMVFKKYETELRIANSKLGRVLNPDGAMFAIRKNLYAPLSPQRGDDFELVIRVLTQGYYSVFEPKALSYEDASVTSRAETARKIRMVSWFIRSTALLMKDMLARGRWDLIVQLGSHKLCRWLTPYFFLALLTANCLLLNAGIFYRVLLALQITGYAAGMAGLYIAEVQKKKPPLFLGAMHYFLVYNYAFFLGVVKGIFSPSDTPATWGKVRA